MQTAHELDVRGLNCPLPILRTRKALNTLQSGEVLTVISSDIGSIKDLASFCKETGHELLDSKTTDKTYQFQIKKH